MTVHLPQGSDLFPMLIQPIWDRRLTHMEFRTLAFIVQHFSARGRMPTLNQIGDCLRYSNAAANFTVTKIHTTGWLVPLGVLPKGEADESR